MSTSQNRKQPFFVNLGSRRLSRRAFAAASAGGAATLAMGGSATLASAQDEPFRAAFIYIGPTGDLGWSYAHDQGRQTAEEAIENLETSYSENVPEVQADAERVIQGYANEGYDFIVANSFGHGPAVLNVAPQFPETQFVHISGFQTDENVSTAFGKIEEPRYVSGMLAGLMAESGSVGYVAAYPIPEVIRGINAFTLGVRNANPDATVQVVWTNTWYDPQAERQATEALLDQGAEVIGQHQDTTAPQQAAEDAGQYAIGYHADMSNQTPDATLTSAIWDWGVYYTWAIEQIIAGEWEPGNEYWGSWEDGVVDLAPIADFVPDDIRDEIEAAAEEFRSGEQNVNTIFSGPLNDQDGTEQLADGESMSDEEILNMEWFVEGVLGDL